jgi:hypothetical protein
MSLTKLIEAVERGEWPGQTNGIARAVFPYNEDWRQDHGVMAHEAFDGSLDAAKRLHDALLPGWAWETGTYLGGLSTAKVWQSNAKGHIAIDADPARAWLLAVLKALEQEGRG